MSYEHQILQILTEVGERGISVHLLSRHVYNMNVSFFATPDMDAISRYVRNYVIRHSRGPKAMLERTGRWGFYRLNMRNALARQKMLEIRRPQESGTQEEAEEPAANPDPDFSLDLFA